jgi:magnesium transporter
MIKAIYVKNGDGAAQITSENIAAVVAEKPKLIWVDLKIGDRDLADDELSLLYDVFKFHELSIEDSLIPQYHPKVEEFDNYIFLAVHALGVLSRNFCELDKQIYELDIFIGRDYIVTVHTGDIPFIETLFEKGRIKPQVELRSVEHLLYSIFQKVVSSYEMAMERINDIVDRIEDKLLGDPSQELIQDIFALKKILLEMRKITEPQKNVYNYFTRETAGLISHKYTAYFRDTAFQFDSLNQQIANHNQLIGSILEVYVSSVTLKLNEIMKFLTIIATIFLPALLVTSYYGMNVTPFLEHRVLGNDRVWYFAVALMAALTLATYLYIRKKKWF